MHSGNDQIPLTKVCSNSAQMCQEIEALVIKHGTRNEISKLGTVRVLGSMLHLTTVCLMIHSCP